MKTSLTKKKMGKWWVMLLFIVILTINISPIVRSLINLDIFELQNVLKLKALSLYLDHIFVSRSQQLSLQLQWILSCSHKPLWQTRTSCFLTWFILPEKLHTLPHPQLGRLVLWPRSRPGNSGARTLIRTDVASVWRARDVKGLRQSKGTCSRDFRRRGVRWGRRQNGEPR